MATNLIAWNTCERLLSDDFEADQSDMDALESEDSDSRAVETQGYLPEALQSMNEFYLTRSVSDGDSHASEGGGRAPEDPDQD